MWRVVALPGCCFFWQRLGKQKGCSLRIRSYPRTETERFTRSQDLLGLIEQQSDNPLWGSFALGLLQGGQQQTLPAPRAALVPPIP